MSGAAGALIVIALAAQSAGLFAPQSSGLFAPQPQRLTVSASADVAAAVPGQPFTLLVDAVPVTGVHVYAPGNKQYLPVLLTLQPAPGIRMREAVYPAGEPWTFGELRELVQVYKTPFQIRQSITLTDRSLKTLVITGVLKYQACTDKICFPVAEVPVHLSLPVTRRAR